MLGTFVNVGAILLGTLIGSLLKHGIPEKVQKIIMQAIGLCVVVIGITSAIKTQNTLLFIFSLAIGGAIGKLIGIENGLEKIGMKLQNRFSKGESTVAEGFVTATLIFCVGAMAILGSLESGLNKNHELLYIKAVLDGLTSMVLASTLGFGVGFSALAVLIYQGLITLGATWVSPFLTQEVMREVSAVGGVLIFGIGINLLDIKKIHVGDMLTAVLIPPIYLIIKSLF
jgi:uncharacterized protein